MNSREKKMVETLLELKEKYHVVGIKAEFEAEGTRLEEAMRLKEISLKSGLKLNLKIGGCEAMKDMFDARNIGIQGIIAPMIESAYALKKYIYAVKNVFLEEAEDIQIMINLETITAIDNFDKMLALPEIKNLNGIVFGRVDLSGSLDLDRDLINHPKILALALEVAAKAKAKGLKVIVGGGISFESLPFLQAFPQEHLDYFETRKVIFSCPGALQNPQEAFVKAIEFELLWLNNKKKYYEAISREDEKRLTMLENRYSLLNYS